MANVDKSIMRETKFCSFSRDSLKDKSDTLQIDARRAKEQLAEMAHTANNHTNVIKKREEQIVELVKESGSLKSERDAAQKQILGLRNDIDTLVVELNAEKDSRSQEVALRSKLQEELDELRALMEARTSEETRRNEVEKSREEEVNDLRSQVTKLNEVLHEARRQTLEGQSKLKLELEYTMKEHASVQKSLDSLIQKERAAQVEFTESQAALSEMDKAKRTLESELRSLRVRQHDHDAQLAEAMKQKEVCIRASPDNVIYAHGYRRWRNS